MANDQELDIQAEEMAQLNNWIAAGTQLILMKKNLQNIAAPISATTIPVASGNLYQIAAKYYEDPLKYKIIQDANNLKDVEIKEFINLIIPTLTNQTIT